MSILERVFSRREVFILPVAAAAVAVLGNSCSPETPIEVPDAARNIIENDLAATGLGEKPHPLIRFEDLSSNERGGLVDSLPQMGLFAINPDETFTFVFLTKEESTGRETLLKITESRSRVKKAVPINGLPMVEIELDLSKFVERGPKGLKIRRYTTAKEYLKILGSISSITLRGSYKDLEPFADKFP